LTAFSIEGAFLFPKGEVISMKCWHYEPKNKDDSETCINCHHWGGTKCKDEALLRKRYEESPKFKALDHMMRGNRGVRIDA
jgi:hypothetical protein